MGQSKNKIVATKELLKILLFVFPNKSILKISNSGKDTSCGQEQGCFSKLPNQCCFLFHCVNFVNKSGSVRAIENISPYSKCDCHKLTAKTTTSTFELAEGIGTFLCQAAIVLCACRKWQFSHKHPFVTIAG